MSCCVEQRLFNGLLSEDPWKVNTYSILERYDFATLPMVASSLLKTPRTLKHALRRVLSAWDLLHGEVDIDHLILVCMLRYSAIEVFSFVERNRAVIEDLQSQQSVHSTIDREARETKWERMRNELQECVAKSAIDSRIVRAAIAFLFPHTDEHLGQKTRISTHPRRQGIGLEKYWLRIVNEAVNQEDSDQAFFRDMDKWEKSNGNHTEYITKLFNEAYLEKWDDVARRFFTGRSDAILSIASAVNNKLLESHGSLAAGSDSANVFLALWRVASRSNIEKKRGTEWLYHEVLNALPVSLSFVNDLYYYYTSVQYGVTDLDGRDNIRMMIYDKAKVEYSTPKQLIHVINPSDPTALYQLVYPPGDSDDHADSPMRGLEYWSFLGPVILEALKLAPRNLCIAAGHLFTDSVRNSDDPRNIVYRSNQQKLTMLFGDNAPQVIHLIKEQREHFIGDERLFIDELVSTA